MVYESGPPADIVVCSHYCPVCVLSSCESGKEGQRELDDNAELMGEKMQKSANKNTAKMEHKGMKKGGEMESGYKITVGPPMRHAA